MKNTTGFRYVYLNELTMEEIKDLLPAFSGAQIETVQDGRNSNHLSVVERVVYPDGLLNGSEYFNVWARSKWIARQGWNGGVYKTLRQDGTESYGEGWSPWANIRVLIDENNKIVVASKSE